MRSALVLVALVACGGEKKQDEAKKDEPKPATYRPKKKLDALQVTLPEGWTKKYDDLDTWVFTSPKLPDGRETYVDVDQTLEVPPGPDAYLAHKLQQEWDKGSTATIVSREGLDDGFAMTIELHAAIDPSHPKRETYVVRHPTRWTWWLRCECHWVPDDATRDQVLALCKSLKP